MLCNEGQIDVLTSGFHQLEVAFSNQPRGFQNEFRVPNITWNELRENRRL